MLLHFCRFYGNCQFCRCHCHLLGEKCGDKIFVKLTIESRNIELFCTQFNSRVERCVLWRPKNVSRHYIEIHIKCK
jgi:hypothetical protein